ncbi:hypothetical protein CKO38_13220 [Rhodospirillum rubrum]|uniref:hypothetical protein n=1 Tax=Rhodospirillum rubrum TaxID=1085 RepID=UPI001902D71F|nr:hypothetical protein [Rhodospirillum rubrum]MBK1665868.1 hypothetical protein [Rhodospirillum rubrum]MBK1677611.1 hypothetical protein [Rhodospirillum rubrum]
MRRSKRTLHVEAINTLLNNEIISVIKNHDWDLLEEVARLAAKDAPLDMAATDPAMFITLRNAITRFHVKGWSHMTPERVRLIAESFAEKPLLRMA